ncbi:acyl-CoA-binding domain-containing protein 5 [Copidosoma floridanum]|uniref:acyl-CoA-binding domain-containing protein 5 n=1 Tax=Copidosoma floridanum TaxID=29053 RepID=UPI0006C9A41E|nr:acyl-CoA-binding domain-containing protein 5 [Copidosoma floridanum]
MTTEEKFKAAVNVIKSLPKNGAYQPSHELMLKFYSYFKQATEGPCTSSKPAFWEVVKKAKWDAWNRLADMSKEDAMNKYVEELKKVVEAMSSVENVASYADDLDSFNRNVPVKDLELVVGPVLEKIRSQSNSPIPETFEDSALSSRKENGDPPDIVNSYRSNGEVSTADDMNAYSGETETEDEFIDSVESAAPAISHKKFSKTHVREDQNEHQKSRHDLNCSFVNNNDNNNFINQIATTLKSLQKDLDQVMVRIANIEQQVLLLTKNQVNTKQNNRNNSVFRWPLPKDPMQLLVLIIVWPFVAQFFVFLLKRCHRRKV